MKKRSLTLFLTAVLCLSQGMAASASEAPEEGPFSPPAESTFAQDNLNDTLTDSAITFTDDMAIMGTEDLPWDEAPIFTEELPDDEIPAVTDYFQEGENPAITDDLQADDIPVTTDEFSQDDSSVLVEDLLDENSPVLSGGSAGDGVLELEDDLTDMDEEDSNAVLPATLKLKSTSYTYTGKVIKPSGIVKDKNGKTVPSKYYKVSYSSGRINVGQYKVKVTFSGGGYSGSKTLSFSIVPASTSIKSLVETEKGVDLTWSRVTTQTSGYEIQYGTDKSFKKYKSINITDNSTTKRSLTGAKPGTTYYFRLRTYKTVDGKKYYSKWSAAKTIKYKGSGSGSESGSSTVVSGSPNFENNIDLNEYSWNSARTVNSYLSKEDNGYLRLQALNNGQIIAEMYDANFSCTARKYIKNELPLFGGFLSGKDYNFIVFGQSNPRESKTLEVLRVVKYDKNFKKLGSISYKDINTKDPFQAGSLRMAEYNGYLYIRTCHTMYKSGDGLNHQANMTFEIRESDLKTTFNNNKVSNSSTGYISHSFNQFIIVDDDGTVVGLDHGDAYPRSSSLTIYNDKGGSGSLGSSGFGDVYWNCARNITVQSYSGNTGNNYTGARVGGLAASSDSYITAGSSINQNSFDKSKTYNVYVSVTPKSTGETTLKYITSYKEGGSQSAGTPHLVKISDNKFLVIWSGVGSGKISYAFIDGNGKVSGSIKTESARLSSCPPTYIGGKTVWYVSNGSSLTFYSISDSGTLQSKEIKK